MRTELVLYSPRKVGFRKYNERALRDNEVRVKSLLSGISHGTEMNYYQNFIPFFHKKWNPEFRMFIKGDVSWSYPTTIGYENVSVITELGKGVENVRVGDRVWVFCPHRETNIVTDDEARTASLEDVIVWS